MRYVIDHDGEDHEVVIRELEDGTYEVQLDGRTLHADFRPAGGEAIYSLLLDGRAHELLIVNGGDVTSVIHHGLDIALRVESERERNARLIAGDTTAGDGSSAHAVMPGIVVSVAVSEGDHVEKGQAVAVLEAMKMENEIRATCAGTVTHVAVTAGETVNAGDLLVEISGD